MGTKMEDIKELRERTGAGVLDCKKALQENDGDLEEAVSYLREKGIADASKKAGRVAAEGMVAAIIAEDKKSGILLEVNCETDFVAKNDNFRQLVEKLAQHVKESDVESTADLMEEAWYADQSKKVSTIIKEAIASIGENINLRRFTRYETDGFLQQYIHLGGKIGVLVDIDGDYGEQEQETAKNIAMQIAASSPEFLARDQVTEDKIEKERKIYREQMLNEGKPEHIIDKIVDGKMDKYFNQVCLLEQEYIRDTDLTVGDYLEDKNIGVKRFVRYEVGEGIETEDEDFAAEVEAEMKN